MQFELAGICGYGAALFCGTGCLHRRESLSGSYPRDCRVKWESKPKRNHNRTIDEVNEASKALATCTYEEGTQWGKEVSVCLFVEFDLKFVSTYSLYLFIYTMKCPSCRIFNKMIQ